MPDPLTAADVLAELDRAAAGDYGAFFPDFDHGYVYHADARLTAYGDGSRWVVVVEQFGVNPRSWPEGGVMTSLRFYGNAVILPPQPGWGEHAVLTVEPLASGPSGAMTDDVQSVNVGIRDVRIRGDVVPVRTDAAYYAERGIDVEGVTEGQIEAMLASVAGHPTPEVVEHVRRQAEEMRAKLGVHELPTWSFVRGLVPEHRDALLATEEERRRGVPADLPKLIQLDDWHHPRVAEGEQPSDSPSFVALAEAIATGDAARYRVEGGNVHWRHWPFSGSL